MKMKTSSFYVNMVRFLTVHIATMYGSAWMVISMTRTKVTQLLFNEQHTSVMGTDSMDAKT